MERRETAEKWSPAEFQSDFTRAITRPDARVAYEDILHEIIPGGRLPTPAAALAVYQRAYPARMTEALGEAFEGVWWILGDAEFFALCERYVRAHPSRSYNLSDYGDRFAAYLAREQPAAYPALPFLGDLAHFEWLFQEVFHARAAEALTAEQLTQVELGESSILPLNPTLRLFESPYSVYEVWRLRQTPQEEVESLNWERAPDAGRQYLALYKDAGRKIAVQRLEQWEQALLRALAAGTPMGEALAALPEGAATPERVSAFFARDFARLHQA